MMTAVPLRPARRRVWPLNSSSANAGAGRGAACAGTTIRITASSTRISAQSAIVRIATLLLHSFPHYGTMRGPHQEQCLVYDRWIVGEVSHANRKESVNVGGLR